MDSPHSQSTASKTSYSVAHIRLPSNYDYRTANQPTFFDILHSSIMRELHRLSMPSPALSAKMWQAVNYYYDGNFKRKFIGTCLLVHSADQTKIDFHDVRLDVKRDDGRKGGLFLVVDDNCLEGGRALRVDVMDTYTGGKKVEWERVLRDKDLRKWIDGRGIEKRCVVEGIVEPWTADSGKEGELWAKAPEREVNEVGEEEGDATEKDDADVRTSGVESGRWPLMSLVETFRSKLRFDK